MQEQLRQLIEHHCETIRQLVDEVGRSLEMSGAAPADECDALARAQSLTHQLKGSSGTIGFLHISVAAEALDNALKPLCAAGEPPTAADRKTLNRHYAELRSSAEGLSPAQSRLYTAACPPATIPRSDASGS